MKTLVELYDDRAIENVIGPETFCPEHVIYLCPTEVAEDREKLKILKAFFEHRGLDMEIEFVESSIYKSDKILLQLRKIAQRCPEMVLDVTGGTDAALFASGMFCKEQGIPTFTYSRKRNKFYDINEAPFADEKCCELEYSVEDFFLMTGGKMRKGRVDNHILNDYSDKYELFFQLFLKHRRQWVDFVTFIQRISQADYGVEPPLQVRGACMQKGERGNRIMVNEQLMHDLEAIEFIREYEFHENGTISFTFADLQIRNWLRDVGSVLELYMYKMCRDTGIFQDVVSSAVVDWDGTVGHDSVSNEIDVVAVRGVVPIFISCKACEVKTSSINELAILKDRFGGKGAKAAIVTTERCNAAARHRAAQLGIAVIDLEELEREKTIDRLKVIMKVATPSV